MKNYLIKNIDEYVKNEGSEFFEFLEGNGYREPIVKFASINDPIFEDFKEIIGEFHLSPSEAYKLSYEDKSLKEGSVISIALPFSEEVIESNKKRDWPSEKWTLMRTFGISGFAHELSDYIKQLLERSGYDAIDPSSQNYFKILSTKTGPSSNWSQRHIAYATGMGTFSLNAGFITDKGIAVTLISLVTNLVVEPDSRIYDNHFANCLYYYKSKCKKCIKKCPVNAISEKGIDKLKCFNMSYGKEAQKYAKSVGAKPELGSGCGLCQVGVPCGTKNPIKQKY